ncbi:energy transducer TonB [Zunongwangia profunda]|jgi:hypothetical protein|uniref:energy transducer TonB n=1 Tax=Zunongwangia profunda TaxID=398743 RepID=UPI000C8E37B0|nr:energy transducer TonB [Zunongwangia profunda]MAG86989.1 energy transducer TonB [Flavobacteriaceae bacterium]MCC4229893.1 energy transducer TonB [Zunongwangia profunda]
MKNLLFTICLLVSFISCGQEHVKTEGNTVTVSEIAPVWPGCESPTNDQDNCFRKKFLELVKTTYKYPRKENGDFIRGKATIKMHIDEKGVAQIDKIETKEPEIKVALEKMLKELPKMTPGKRAGKSISIKYTIPVKL